MRLAPSKGVMIKQGRSDVGNYIIFILPYPHFNPKLKKKIEREEERNKK